MLGVAARVNGQRLAVLAAVGSPPRLLPPPSPLQEAGAPLCRAIRGGDGGCVLGRGARSCRGGVQRHWSYPSPSCPSHGTITAGRGRHLRRCLCGGWGCSGGAFGRQ